MNNTLEAAVFSALCDMRAQRRAESFIPFITKYASPEVTERQIAMKLLELLRSNRILFFPEHQKLQEALKTILGPR